VTDPAETARLIEQDRQRREREWWLLLLFLFDEGGIDDVASHIRHDGDVGRVLNNVLGKAIVPLSRVSAAAHIGGMRRFANLTGQTFSPMDDAAKAAIARQYEATARQAVTAIIAKLTQSVADVREKFPDEAASIVAQSAFDNAGMSSTNKSALKLGAERSIVQASNIGMLEAAKQVNEAERRGGSELPTKQAIGLAHHSIIDSRTTDICLDRHGLVLPADHPYWRHNLAPLHPRCRSCVLPVLPPYEADTVLPTVPPAPGWGAMPIGFLAQFGLAA
jgi:SPP1 gp7 family putative phage head morphogenesis protein